MASNKKLAKGMVLVLAANVFSMVINVLLNFFHPKYLSVETYAAIKSFALYMSCAGLFHLGYEDGMYLKYGGKDSKLIDKNELGKNISTLRIFQLTISCVTFFVGVLFRESVLSVFAIFLFPYNMTMYYRLLFQATGEFSLYGRILNISSVILFSLNVLLIFGVHTDSYILYLLVYVAVYVIVWIVLEVYVSIKFKIRKKVLLFSGKELIESIKSGFFIMIGNFSSIFLTSMDRWFVKFLLNSLAFAEYSFAVSLESMLNVVVTPFTVTLYNYFCQKPQKDKILRMRNGVCLFSVFIVSAAFPAKFIIELWLPHYKGAESVVFYLFSAQILFIIIKSIFVNLYKAQKRQKEYFIKLMIVLLTGALFNSICFILLRVKEAMAIGTLFSAILWFVLCQIDFKDIRFDFLHCIYIAVEIIAFNVTGKLFSALVGFAVYLLFTVGFSLVMLKSEVLGLLKEAKGIMYKRKKSNAEGI